MKPIRTEREYEAALARIGELMSAPEGSQEADELAVLAILVEKYEAERYPIEDAPANEVLKLYMEANELSAKDLIPYLGSPSTVSKVLQGKKELTLHQVRAMSRELGIPAAALVGSAAESSEQFDWAAFPLVEMARRGLFGADKIREGFNQLVGAARDLLFSLVGSARIDLSRPALLRQGIRPTPSSNTYAVIAWLLEVGHKAQSVPVKEYTQLTEQDMRAVATMSLRKDGPLEAVAYLADRGVAVVFVEHYRRSKLDGGVVILDGGRPAIGMTLRYDRMDYFWFTLLHEMAHIVLGHTQTPLAEIVLDGEKKAKNEQEANELVEKVTIPSREFFKAFPTVRHATLEAIINLATRFQVAVPIVVGRVQYLSGDYRKFSKLLGRGRLRKMFGIAEREEEDGTPA